jgi:SAM-dependent methyltransferase
MPETFISHSASHVQQWFRSDEKFNQLYPIPVQMLARRHWTPLTVARKAADFLAAQNNVKILDIGSGAGKFCLAAAWNKPNAFFFGIEQRKNMLIHAEAAREVLGLQNVSFLHGNFTQLELCNYDHFYFYNSFYENLAGTDKIDDQIDYSGELYNYYNRYLFKQLDKTRAGTRLVTFHSLEDEVPPSFHVADTDMNGLLKCWVKE